jgi:8-oxo-dGTP pyrophosphatase MutT (NUDIX family)
MPQLRYDMVGVWIVRRGVDGWEHLQLRRADDDYMGGLWSLCRGGVEPGESAVGAALREMEEETGLSPAEFYRMGTLEQFYTSAHDTIWIAPFFAAVVTPTAEVRLNKEHTAHRWTPDAEMPAALVWPSEQHLLTELRTYILATHPTQPHMRIPLPPNEPR